MFGDFSKLRSPYLPSRRQMVTQSAGILCPTFLKIISRVHYASRRWRGKPRNRETFFRTILSTLAESEPPATQQEQRPIVGGDRPS